MTIAAGVPGYSVFVPDSHSVTRHDVEDLLFAEADLLDEWNLDGWLGLFTDDARYVVPATDSRDADPDKDLVLVDDDRMRMESRVVRLNSRRAHREYPHSQTRHLVTNVRLGARTEDALAVTAAFAVFRSRGGRHVDYVGRYDYRLAVVGGQLLIRHKRVELDLTSLRPAYDVAIIL